MTYIINYENVCFLIKYARALAKSDCIFMYMCICMFEDLRRESLCTKILISSLLEVFLYHFICKGVFVCAIFIQLSNYASLMVYSVRFGVSKRVWLLKSHALTELYLDMINLRLLM